MIIPVRGEEKNTHLCICEHYLSSMYLYQAVLGGKIKISECIWSDESSLAQNSLFLRLLKLHWNCSLKFGFFLCTWDCVRHTFVWFLSLKHFKQIKFSETVNSLTSKQGFCGISKPCTNFPTKQTNSMLDKLYVTIKGLVLLTKTIENGIRMRFEFFSLLCVLVRFLFWWGE